MDSKVTLAHGSGGAKSRELVEQLFRPAFENPYLNPLTDSALLRVPENIAMTTDSYVVRPLFFPGGDIGKLAVCGTMNDLAVSGAIPRFMSVGMILAYGLDMEVLRRIVESMAKTAREAGIQIVTGDTKVVEQNSADGIFINTTGIGIYPEVNRILPQRILEGDCIVASGNIASHGVSVMAERNHLGFEPVIESDVASLFPLINILMSDRRVEIHAMRDPTRGGIASTLCEWANEGLDISIQESKLPIRKDVRAACKILGLDPIYIANEGVVLLSISKNSTDLAISLLRQHPLGQNATVIGEVQCGRGKVIMQTPLGTFRRIYLPAGELLPRIC